MILIVGLGNVGEHYVENRHNVGFMVVDTIAQHYGFPAFRSQFRGSVSQKQIGHHPVILLKPTTMMNLSGQSVGELTRFFKIPNESVIVIHDELDLPFCSIRIKQGGGHAGHNGLKSLDAHLGPDYWRIRFGIGHPGDKTLVTSHVLGNFSKTERQQVNTLSERMAKFFPNLLDGQRNVWLDQVIIKTHRNNEENHGI